jgi:hypothetical protein
VTDGKGIYLHSGGELDADEFASHVKYSKKEIDGKHILIADFDFPDKA